MTHASLLDALNPSQRQAVQHFCGPLLVVAGAGSGKTRALTHRIAYLVRHYRVDPGEILAVTFTNKAAREMKERIEQLFAEQEAQEQFGIPLEELEPAQATRLKSAVYHRWIKPLWIGTFHSLFAQILRIDIEKYQDPKGRKWTRHFSIFDESDAQSLVKEIVTKQLNLDERKFDPRSVRYAISNAKNQGWTPADLERNQPNFRGRTIAQVYEIYEDQLAANNALDFDNLIWIPVQLFRQNEQVLAYWHQRFRHILVDEYQDTNRTQYELIRLLATNGETCRSRLDWRNRSIFVVGDADQSIYRFRGADFTILLEFQETFGDGLPDDDTRTMIKLEENYRSTATILQAANALIEKNTERIDKVLRPTRQQGNPIFLHQADDEIAEAEFVVNTIRRLHGQNANAFSWGDFAILYRINAQSRPFEEVLLQVHFAAVKGSQFHHHLGVDGGNGQQIHRRDGVGKYHPCNNPLKAIDHFLGLAAQLGLENPLGLFPQLLRLQQSIVQGQGSPLGIEHRLHAIPHRRHLRLRSPGLGSHPHRGWSSGSYQHILRWNQGVDPLPQALQEDLPFF